MLGATITLCLTHSVRQQQQQPSCKVDVAVVIMLTRSMHSQLLSQYVELQEDNGDRGPSPQEPTGVSEDGIDDGYKACPASR